MQSGKGIIVMILMGQDHCFKINSKHSGLG